MPVKTKSKRARKSREPHFLLREWVAFWLLVLASVALVAAIFGKVDVRTLLAKPEVKIVEREVERIIEVEKEVASTAADYEQDFFDYRCYTPNPGPPETYFTYLDKRTSVRIELPYSFSWGSLDCPPIERAVFPEGREVILFGPSVRVEGEGVARDSRISILDATSTSAIRTKIDEELSQVKIDSSAQDISPVRQRTVNGLTVFSYSYYSLGQTNQWVAVGRNYVYRIVSGGWLTDAEAVKIIQSLRVTK